MANQVEWIHPISHRQHQPSSQQGKTVIKPLAISTIRVHSLPCNQKFCFGLNRHCIFASSFFIFDFEYVWTYFFSMFYSFAISLLPLSCCATKSQQGDKLCQSKQYMFSCPAGTQFPNLPRHQPLSRQLLFSQFPCFTHIHIF